MKPTGVTVVVSIQGDICRYTLSFDGEAYYPSYLFSTIDYTYSEFCDRALATLRQTILQELRHPNFRVDAICVMVAGSVENERVRATTSYTLKCLIGQPVAEDFSIEFESPAALIGREEAKRMGEEGDPALTIFRDDRALAGAYTLARQLASAS